MKKLKIFPKMFIQIFSVLGIIIILVHSLVFFIFPKTYLETRKMCIRDRGYAANLEESVGTNGSVVTGYQYEQNNHSDSQFRCV